MEVPLGLEMNPQKVYKLKKALYGLKQSPRVWFDRFTRAIKHMGYEQCQSNYTLFVKYCTIGKRAILIVYVDAIILTADHSEEIQKLKDFLVREFEIKEFVILKYFLQMEVARSKKGISISQRKYILDLLKETSMLGCKPVETPMKTNVKLNPKSDSKSVDKERYQRFIGKLIYLPHTRLDINFAVSSVSHFISQHTEKHMSVVYRILRYLKITPAQGLFFQKTMVKDIEIYTDTDCTESVTDRRSTSVYCSYV
ncbi:uncharacterized protein LOC110825430 [Carica papaya]|uniref:uncharacterized protein LOC110825430 n=1 Tax=Carica papaya TaxID=3649 RepID=UPI000B8CEC29|nr:uncharacterized protein LOC110825430 [Carica papaya]